jgi:ketosteroid isomerase-like protein
VTSDQADFRAGQPGYAAAVALCEGFNARDWERVRAVLHADIEFSVAGVSAIAGEYVGPDQVAALFQRMVDISGNTLRFAPNADDYDILLSRVHVAVLGAFHAERDDGRRLEYCYQLWFFHIGDDNLGMGGITVMGDQADFDSFFS